MHYDVIILGAGAAGLMGALTAGARGRSVLVLDHGKRPGQKILMSGGGKCNFTNLDVSAANYLSQNPHFCKSALKQFSQWDFLQMVQAAGIAYEERAHGQLFTLQGSHLLVDMLLEHCRAFGVHLRMGMEIQRVEASPKGGFAVETREKSSEACVTFSTPSLVVATGGLSYPTAGASPLGYHIAEQFGLTVVPRQAALVPFSLTGIDKELFGALSGIAVPARVQAGSASFTENLLFTHRGLSGPVALQASNYWNVGEEICVDLLPGLPLVAELRQRKETESKKLATTVLNELLPKRLVAARLQRAGLTPLGDKKLAVLSHAQIESLAAALQNWILVPAGTEGYRTAEVTRGGVDTSQISSQSMEALAVPGLYFAGEVLDVTGWLGGYNLQWAWSSGYSAGMRV